MMTSEATKLKQYIEKIEHLEDEKVELAEHINDVFRQAKIDGFDTKIMKRVLKIKKMKTQDREEQDLLLDTYMLALGLIAEND